jgi:hypothetical protein
MAGVAPNQTQANALAAGLQNAGFEARVSGAGVHWQVDVTNVGDGGANVSRSVRVHCFFCERAITGLLLGMNPSNARSQLGRAQPEPYEGPEYAITLQEGKSQLSGRTRAEAEVITSVSAWLGGALPAELEKVAPFIDEKPRAMRALAARIALPLRHELGDEPSSPLWIYGEGRSCRLGQGTSGVSCGVLLGQAQVAYAGHLEPARLAVAAWLVEGADLRSLAARVPEVAVERHAELLERDPAAWHWAHLRERIAHPGDVLAPLRELVETLASLPSARTFYSYSSLNRLCFSASSHYPWVDQGLPIVGRDGDGRHWVEVDGGSDFCDLATAVRRIEATLAASPIRPFFGSAPHHDRPLVAEALERRGSPLRPRLEQRGAWYRLVVASRDGTRQCTVEGRRVTFVEGDRWRLAEWPTIDGVAGGLHAYLEEGASFAAAAATGEGKDLSVRKGA